MAHRRFLLCGKCIGIILFVRCGAPSCTQTTSPILTTLYHSQPIILVDLDLVVPSGENIDKYAFITSMSCALKGYS